MVARGGWHRGPRQEVYGRTLTMHDQGQSDRPVVPTKSPNNVGQPAAEGMEGRGLTKGTRVSKTRSGRSTGTMARAVRWRGYVK